eukprot:496886-Alexandrium_andersonii.AAC.1
MVCSGPLLSFSTTVCAWPAHRCVRSCLFLGVSRHSFISECLPVSCRERSRGIVPSLWPAGGCSELRSAIFSAKG